MTRFEKGSNCAKDAMTKCREAKQAKRLNKKQDSPSSTIMFGGAIDEMIKNDVKEEIKNEIVLKKPKDNSKKEVKQNIQMEISKEEIKPPADNKDMKALIYELQQQILDIAKDVDYLLMRGE
mgnify:CR=1 FL=1|jgi:hypothetical protein